MSNHHRDPRQNSNKDADDWRADLGYGFVSSDSRSREPSPPPTRSHYSQSYSHSSYERERGRGRGYEYSYPGGYPSTASYNYRTSYQGLCGDPYQNQNPHPPYPYYSGSVNGSANYRPQQSSGFSSGYGHGQGGYAYYPGFYHQQSLRSTNGVSRKGDSKKDNSRHRSRSPERRNDESDEDECIVLDKGQGSSHHPPIPEASTKDDDEDSWLEDVIEVDYTNSNDDNTDTDKQKAKRTDSQSDDCSRRNGKNVRIHPEEARKSSSQLNFSVPKPSDPLMSYNSLLSDLRSDKSGNSVNKRKRFSDPEDDELDLTQFLGRKTARYSSRTYAKQANKGEERESSTSSRNSSISSSRKRSETRDEYRETFPNFSMEKRELAKSSKNSISSRGKSSESKTGAKRRETSPSFSGEEQDRESSKSSRNSSINSRRKRTETRANHRELSPTFSNEKSHMRPEPGSSSHNDKTAQSQSLTSVASTGSTDEKRIDSNNIPPSSRSDCQKSSGKPEAEITVKRLKDSPKKSLKNLDRCNDLTDPLPPRRKIDKSSKIQRNRAKERDKSDTDKDNGVGKGGAVRIEETETIQTDNNCCSSISSQSSPERIKVTGCTGTNDNLDPVSPCSSDDVKNQDERATKITKPASPALLEPISPSCSLSSDDDERKKTTTSKVPLPMALEPCSSPDDQKRATKINSITVPAVSAAMFDPISSNSCSSDDNQKKSTKKKTEIPGLSISQQLMSSDSSNEDDGDSKKNKQTTTKATVTALAGVAILQIKPSKSSINKQQPTLEGKIPAAAILRQLSSNSADDKKTETPTGTTTVSSPSVHEVPELDDIKQCPWEGSKGPPTTTRKKGISFQFDSPTISTSPNDKDSILQLNKCDHSKIRTELISVASNICLSSSGTEMNDAADDTTTDKKSSRSQSQSFVANEKVIIGRNKESLIGTGVTGDVDHKGDDDLDFGFKIRIRTDIFEESD